MVVALDAVPQERKLGLKTHNALDFSLEAVYDS
jgi:hypothetical protein